MGVTNYMQAETNLAIKWVQSPHAEMKGGERPK